MKASVSKLMLTHLNFLVNKLLQLLNIQILMYQSIPSLTIPRAKPQGIFERENSLPPPLAQRKCETPTLGAEKSG